MSEDRWSNRVEWANERRCEGEYEIQMIRALKTFGLGDKCMSADCDEIPVILYRIGRFDCNGGEEILLCLRHNSQEHAWRVFQRGIE